MDQLPPFVREEDQPDEAVGTGSLFGASGPRSHLHVDGGQGGTARHRAGLSRDPARHGHEGSGRLASLSLRCPRLALGTGSSEAGPRHPRSPRRVPRTELSWLLDAGTALSRIRLTGQWEARVGPLPDEIHRGRLSSRCGAVPVSKVPRVSPCASAFSARPVSPRPPSSNRPSGRGVEVVAIAARDRDGPGLRTKHSIPRVLDSYEQLVADPISTPSTTLCPTDCTGAGRWRPWRRANTSVREALHGQRRRGRSVRRPRRIWPCSHGGLPLPLSPAVRPVRELISSGTIGTVRSVQAALCFPLFSGKDIRWDPRLAGGPPWTPVAIRST